MNIWAIKGHKVKLKEESYEIEGVLKTLELEKEYLIERTEVGGSHTSVYLQGFKRAFNSVNFEDVAEQTLLDDIKHDNYFKWRSKDGKEKIMAEVQKLLRKDKLKRVLK